MKHSTRTADAIHILLLVMLHEGPLSSAGIAKSVATNPAYVRKLMSQLSKGGLLLSSQGKSEPRLARDASTISMLDVYQVMEPDPSILQCDTHTNPDCHQGVHIQLEIQNRYDQIQQQTEAMMAGISLADIYEGFKHRVSQTE